MREEITVYKNYGELNELQQAAVVEKVYKSSEHPIQAALYEGQKEYYMDWKEELARGEEYKHIAFNPEKLHWGSNSQGWYFERGTDINEVITPKSFVIEEGKSVIQLEGVYTEDSQGKASLKFGYTLYENGQSKLEDFPFDELKLAALRNGVEMPLGFEEKVKGFEKEYSVEFENMLTDITTHISDCNDYYPSKEDIYEYLVSDLLENKHNEVEFKYTDELKKLESQKIEMMECYEYKHFEDRKEEEEYLKKRFYDKGASFINTELMKGVPEDFRGYAGIRTFSVTNGEYVLERDRKKPYHLPGNQIDKDTFVFKKEFNRDSAFHFLKEFDKALKQGIHPLECVYHGVFAGTDVDTELTSFYAKKFKDYTLVPDRAFNQDKESDIGVGAYMTKAKEEKSGLYVLVRGEFVNGKDPEQRKVDVFVVKDDFDAKSAKGFLKMHDKALCDRVWGKIVNNTKNVSEIPHDFDSRTNQAAKKRVR